MLSLTTTQQNIIDSAFKKPDWLFEVTDTNGTVYHWSTKEIPVSSSQIKWNSETWMPYVRWDAEEEYAHTFMISNFAGIELYRNKAEMGLVAPNNLTFTVLNPATALIPSDFNGGTVRIALKVSNGTDGEVIRRWRFVIKKTEPAYQKFKVVCEDYLQDILRGDYPNTRLIREIFGNSDTDARGDNLCVPIPFGTAYIPTRSVYIDDAVYISGTDISAVESTNGSRCLIRRSGTTDFKDIEWGRYVTIAGFTEASNNGSFLVSYATADMIELSESAGLVTEAAGDTVTITQGARHYVLGDDAYTYTISEVRSPRAWGRKSTWASSTTTIQWDDVPFGDTPAWASNIAWDTADNFLQEAKSDGVENWQVFQPIIADANNDGEADSCGVWRQGEMFLDMPTKLARSDTSAMTNPADILLFILRDMGVSDIDLATFATSKATYSGWGLTWNGALWYKENRKTTLARLLLMCHSNLVAGEAVELYPLSAVSQKTITSADILKPDDIGEGSFEYTDIRTEQITDCGYVAWQNTGEAQDRFVKSLVPAVGSTKTRYSKTILELPWVQDSQNVQRLGTLFFQRALLGEATVSFAGKGSLLALNPGDVITINGQNYGGGYIAMETWTSDPATHFISLADGQAFIRIDTVDLSPYAGTEGLDTPYMAVLSDGLGGSAYGYIGAADAAEALGSELMTNGDNEAAIATFDEDLDVYSASIQSAEQHRGAGANSTKVTLDGTSYFGYRSFSDNNLSKVATGKLYKVSAWFYLPGGQTIDRVRLYTSGTGITAYTESSTTASWVQLTNYVTVDTLLTVYCLALDSGSANNSDYFYIDDISIQEVTDIGTEGIHIVSRQNGSTRNWASIDDDFVYNGSTYSLEISRRYPVVIDSMRINKDLSINLSCTKYSYQPLDDFTDLSPSAIVPSTDDTTNMWAPAVTGPLSDENMASDLVENIKTYLTVSPNTNQGSNADLQAAINSLKDKNYSGIFLKSGDYYLSSSVYIPPYDIEIIGENKSKTRIFNPPDNPAFRSSNFVNLSLDSFTMMSRNTMSGKILISLDVANAAMLRNLIFHAWNEQIGVIGSIGDLTVRIAQNDYMNSKVSKSTILNCEFYNGFRGIDIGSNSSVSHTVSVEGCFFNNQTSTGLLTAAETNLINANIFENFANGIWASWASPKTIITNNVLRTNYVGRAINAGGSNITCQGNTIYAALPGTVGTVYLIFGDENTNGGIISNNSIYMTVVGANTIYGIILSSSNKVSVCGNNIYLSNSDTTYNHYGIGISDSDGCLVDGNIINLVNNNAQDIGIWLQSGSENNSGGGATNPSNITHNCGTGVLNEGGGTNSVTSKDV